jgi:hypothetical protein
VRFGKDRNKAQAKQKSRQMVQKNIDWLSARSGKSQAIFINVNHFHF